jgi:uracil-DNA glycosylase family 4
MFIGEAPGPRENEKGVCFIGPTGEEVNRGYLPTAGLRRPNHRFTNAIHCQPGGNGKLDISKQAHLDLLQSCCETHLYPEIEQLQPKLIIPMGTFACHAIDPSIELDRQHGIPTDTPCGMAFPMYHPAGGMHEPKKMLQIRTDWTRLKKYINGTLRIPFDEYQGLEDYAAIEDPDQIDALLWGKWHLNMGADTEITFRRKPFCATFSIHPGTGYLVRADDRPCLDRLNYHLRRWEGRFLFHNWLFDKPVTEDMGLDFRNKQVKDTMLLAFHLGNLPQGLKTLAYRELGMLMQDFNDLVIPHSRKHVLAYYREAHLIDWPKPPEQLVRDKEGLYKLYRPHSFNTRLKTFFTSYEKNPDRDVSKMWDDNWEDMHDQVEAAIGPWPGKCISHAPFEEIIGYACRDSDATLRLLPVLQHMKSRVRKKSQEHWGD